MSQIYARSVKRKDGDRHWIDQRTRCKGSNGRVLLINEAKATKRSKIK